MLTNSDILIIVAKQIYEDYLTFGSSQHTEEGRDFYEWGNLSDLSKTPFLVQAERLIEQLSSIGWIITDKGKGEPFIISEEETEKLAKTEHEYWMEDRLKEGWTSASERNVEKKETPYFIPYEDLSEEIKELDRVRVRQIPKVLERAGLYVLYSKQL